MLSKQPCLSVSAGAALLLWPGGCFFRVFLVRMNIVQRGGGVFLCVFSTASISRSCAVGGGRVLIVVTPWCGWSSASPPSLLAVCFFCCCELLQISIIAILIFMMVRSTNHSSGSLFEISRIGSPLPDSTRPDPRSLARSVNNP